MRVALLDHGKSPQIKHTLFPVQIMYGGAFRDVDEFEKIMVVGRNGRIAPPVEIDPRVQKTKFFLIIDQYVLIFIARIERKSFIKMRD